MRTVVLALTGQAGLQLSAGTESDWPRGLLLSRGPADEDESAGCFVSFDALETYERVPSSSRHGVKPTKIETVQ